MPIWNNEEAVELSNVLFSSKSEEELIELAVDEAIKRNHTSFKGISEYDTELKEFGQKKNIGELLGSKQIDKREFYVLQERPVGMTIQHFRIISNMLQILIGFRNRVVVKEKEVGKNENDDNKTGGQSKRVKKDEGEAQNRTIKINKNEREGKSKGNIKRGKNTNPFKK